MDQELIKTLSDSAWEFANANSSDGDGRHGILYRAKFAELILNKCIESVKNNDITGEYKDYVYGYNSALRDSVRAINREFDV